MASIVFDIDGFFQLSDDGNKYFSDETSGITLDYDFETLEGLFQQYYLGYRSSMYVCEDSIDDGKEDEVYKTIKEYNQNCMKMAMGAALAHLSGKSHVPVDFLWIAKHFIIEQIQERYHDANKIEIRLSMKPSISAHTENDNIIVFPALARSVLLHFNLLLLNDFYRKDDDELLPNKIDRQGLARFCLPYFLFCHDNLSVRNLPIIGAATYDAFTTAYRLTFLQLIFIIAHEYAHLLLHHNRKKIVDSEINKNIEKEADNLALEILLDYITTSHGDTAADVFTALRLLFKYQLLEYETGCLVRGENLDGDPELENRRSNVQRKVIENENLKRFYAYDAFCFAEAVELQNILQEYGAPLIDDIIDAFYESENTGEIRPWWETIKNK